MNLAPPVIVDSQAQLDEMVRDMTARPAIAVDTESNSLYAYHERICLIQFSTPQHDYLVDPLANIDLTPLGDLFANPALQKVFHAAEQDIAGLRRDVGCDFANIFDTMRGARILGWPRVGLANIMQETFGVHTNKRYQRYNWGQRPLAPEALHYARLDTHYLLALRDLEMEALQQAGRAAEATEVFARLTDTPPAVNPFGAHAFWRVKGIRDLDKQELAILWQLYLWRDKEASRRNRPPFKVMGDKVLMALAVIQPDCLSDLEDIPGLTPYLVRRYGSTLLAVVERGRDGPLPERPASKPRPKDAVVNRYQALRAWRRGVAERRGVDSDVVLCNNTLWELARSRPSSLEDLKRVKGLGPWKRERYGAEILHVLGG